jgi:hypothetical protein
MEVKVGDLCYHKHMYQQFEVLSIDGNYVWLKSEDHYLTTMKSQLEKEKALLPLPDNDEL